MPHDGWFYVVFQGEIKGRFRNKKKAEELYRELLDKSGYKPDRPAGAKERSDSVERYLDSLEDYWSASHKHARRGGKGRY